MVCGALFGSFEANTGSFQVKTLTSKDLVTLAEKPQFICIDTDLSVDQ